MIVFGSRITRSATGHENKTYRTYKSYFRGFLVRAGGGSDPRPAHISSDQSDPSDQSDICFQVSAVRVSLSAISGPG